MQPQESGNTKEKSENKNPRQKRESIFLMNGDVELPHSRLYFVKRNPLGKKQ